MAPPSKYVRIPSNNGRFEHNLLFLLKPIAPAQAYQVIGLLYKWNDAHPFCINHHSHHRTFVTFELLSAQSLFPKSTYIFIISANMEEGNETTRQLWSSNLDVDHDKGTKDN